MNPSYFRIKLDMKQAIERLCRWNGKDCEEKIETEYGDAVSVALDGNGQWKGSCLYVYENDGWTVFEDLSGGYSFIDVEQWLVFAEKDDLVVAGYNDAVIYAEMIVITKGVVTKQFVECDDMPEENINVGDGIAGIKDWTDVAAFVDEDEFVYSETGTVIIF